MINKYADYFTYRDPISFRVFLVEIILLNTYCRDIGRYSKVYLKTPTASYI